MVYDNDCKYNIFKCKLTKKEERVIEPESEEEQPSEPVKEEETGMLSVSQLGERMVKQLSKMGLTGSSETGEETGL